MPVEELAQLGPEPSTGAAPTASQYLTQDPRPLASPDGRIRLVSPTLLLGAEWGLGQLLLGSSFGSWLIVGHSDREAST